MTPLPAPLKIVPSLIASALPQSRSRRLLLLLGHMRSGSTALSSVLCAHPAISGYGETHVVHGRRWSGGAIVLNQLRRGAWRWRAHYLFDKALHDAYDEAAGERFFRARAIFLAREPAASVASIRKLADTLGLGLWRTDQEAADYYEARVARLLALWPRFAPERRTGLTHAGLVADPDAVLMRLTAFLDLKPPLSNAYASREVGTRRGAGDPLVAGRQTRIMPDGSVSSLGRDAAPLAVPAGRLEALTALYREFERTCARGTEPTDGLDQRRRESVGVSAASSRASAVSARSSVSPSTQPLASDKA